MDLSLYVPVHDAEESLPRLLASLEKLPSEQVEIVLVDDASRDRSAERLAAFAERRPNVRLHRRDRNGGMARCVNDALARCRGEWIQRCDADDEVLADGVLAALERAVADDLDAVLQPYERIEPDGRARRRDPEPLRPDETPAERYWRKATPSCCAVLARRAIAERHRVRVPEQIPKGGDALWLREYMAHVERDRVAVSDRLSYRYHVRPGSLSHQRPAEKARRSLLALDATLLLGEDLVRRGVLERGFMERELSSGLAATALRQLVQAGQRARALAEYHRLRARLGSSPRLRRQYYRAVLPGIWRLVLP